MSRTATIQKVTSLEKLKPRIREMVKRVTPETLDRVCQRLDYCLYVCRIQEARALNLCRCNKIWRASHSLCATEFPITLLHLIQIAFEIPPCVSSTLYFSQNEEPSMQSNNIKNSYGPKEPPRSSLDSFKVD
jgi:hypothetical protein